MALDGVEEEDPVVVLVGDEKQAVPDEAEPRGKLDPVLRESGGGIVVDRLSEDKLGHYPHSRGRGFVMFPGDGSPIPLQHSLRVQTRRTPQHPFP